MSGELGPVYGVNLIDALPLGSGSMKQAMPTRSDLLKVQRVSERTVAGYEVLLDHYKHQCSEVERLKNVIRQVIRGKWSVTELQEVIGDI